MEISVPQGSIGRYIMPFFIDMICTYILKQETIHVYQALSKGVTVYFIVHYNYAFFICHVK